MHKKMSSQQFVKGGFPREVVMVIGIMGYSGSGKSTLSEEFKKLGAFVIDADKIGKDILSPGSEGLKKVISVFGEEFLFPDGSLNRKMLGEVVFKSREKLELLNSITWAQIDKKIKEAVAASEERVTIIDCPLLYKVSSYKLCHEVIFINTPDEILIKRIMKRDGLDYNTAKARIDSQKDEAFIKHATIILENTSVEGLKADAERLMKGWLK
ncbi:MAG: dephospho-CoA kinase [Ruminococcaceae bacterium]|nr:dephospho-CoA kinase [Oscillospiraceae bacterium]